MKPTRTVQFSPLALVLWSIQFFSALALVYYIRWFVAFLIHGTAFLVPDGGVASVWFVVQMGSNFFFLYVGFLLLRLLRSYRQNGFFTQESLRIFDGLIFSCLGLAVLGAVQTVTGNFGEVHFQEWTSLESSANLLLRSFINLLVLHTPQTLYILMAMVLLEVKRFVAKAMEVKLENESFI